MSGDPGGPQVRRDDYRMARIGAAAALVVAIVFLVVYDAISPDYEVNGVVLVTMIAAMLTLLGLEARDILKGS